MSLASWFNDTISVASVTGSPDAYGKPTYAAARQVASRVQPRRKRLFLANGEYAISTHVVYTAELVLIDDRIWLPGVSSSSPEGSLKPLAITVSNDKAGAQRLVKVEL